MASASPRTSKGTSRRFVSGSTGTWEAAGSFAPNAGCWRTTRCADFGVLYDCGQSRDGHGYVDVTSSDSAEVQEAKKMMLEILTDKPVPDVGLPKERKKK